MKPMRGMSLIDVLIGTALVLVIFLALNGLLRTSLLLASFTKSQAIATNIANGQMEYIRSLPYDSLGTIGGIPPGTIPQYATTTQNGIVVVTRTFIDYVDSPVDGFGIADTNGITTDYKEIKITATFFIKETPRSLTFVSSYSPKGIETTNNGGTLQVNVVNATGSPVPGATVRIVNASTTPTVDITTFSDVGGVVAFPGAATSTEYQVFISRAGYSSAQTYPRNGANLNPTPGYLTVVKDQTTSATFAIDMLTNLSVRTFFPIATTSFSDTFSGSSKVTSSTNVSIGGGLVTLFDRNISGIGPNNYQLSGTFISTTTAPTYLALWGNASSTTNIPGGTTAVFKIADASGTLLPNTVLPGNSAGFTTTVNLSSISTTTYPELRLVGSLSTIATSTTPSIYKWGISYGKGPLPVSGVPLSLIGTKIIGTTGSGANIYKISTTTTSDANGFKAFSLEWDSYDLTLSGYTITTSTALSPFILAPGTTLDTPTFIKHAPCCDY
jgi:hypothetical protein